MVEPNTVAGLNRSPSFLLHFHNREILAMYGADRRGDDQLLCHTLLLTRYALLASPGPLVIMPKFAFEVPYFKRYLWHIRPVVSAGLVKFVSDNPDFSYSIQEKQQQYAGQAHLFSSYFQPEEIDSRLELLSGLGWEPRRGGSATEAIKAAWYGNLESGEAGVLTAIARELAGKSGSTSRIIAALEKVPGALSGRAFVLDHVRALLGISLNGTQLTRLNFLINKAYLHLFVSAHGYNILVDTPLGELDCGLRSEPISRHCLVSFAAMQGFAHLLGIRRLIETGLTWSQLVELREDMHFRWFFRFSAEDVADDVSAMRLIEDAMRKPSPAALLRDDLTCTLDELRRHLGALREAICKDGVLDSILCVTGYTLAGSSWLKRRLRDRERPRFDQDRQLTLRVSDEGFGHAHPRKPDMKVDVGIITMKHEEFSAVLDRFEERTHYQKHRFYELSCVTRRDTGVSTRVAILRTPEQGSGAAMEAARDLIDDLDPSIIVLAGIGGGLPSSDYTLGDVILATSVSDLRVRAVLAGGKQEFATTGARAHKAVALLLAHLPAFEKEISPWCGDESVRVTRPTVSLADVKTVANTSEQWKNAIRASLERHFDPGSPRGHPIALTGAVSSSDTLIKDAEYAQDLKTFIRQVLAFEMEAAGVFQAADQKHKHYPVLVVRGISDVVGLERDPHWTLYACHTAASLTHQLIVSGVLQCSIE